MFFLSVSPVPFLTCSRSLSQISDGAPARGPRPVLPDASADIISASIRLSGISMHRVGRDRLRGRSPWRQNNAGRSDTQPAGITDKQRSPRVNPLPPPLGDGTKRSPELLLQINAEPCPEYNVFLSASGASVRMFGLSKVAEAADRDRSLERTPDSKYSRAE